MENRLDTKLEAEGAEFLVLGLMLIEGINAYKAYVNFPGYDLTAVNPDSKKIARIQVKSRYATDYDKSFPLKSLDCDFVVHVALNRGYSFHKKGKSEDTGIQPPQFYIFPIKVVEQIRNETGWNKVRITQIPDYEKYLNNWELIKKYLKPKKQLITQAKN